jgi:sulfatase modifying factor 1
MKKSRMIIAAAAAIMTAAGIAVSLADAPEVVSIPAGSFSMGDHSGLGGEDPNHPSDERPLHTVNISAFSMGKYHVTNDQYCAFLNSVYAAGALTVANGIVFPAGSTDTLFRTTEATRYSRISLTGGVFSVRANKGSHPVTDVRWLGAAAYCNWLNRQEGRDTCYTLATGECNFSAKGYRLPTEAEWEYAAYGGRTEYPIFPWGSDTSAAVYGKYANWEKSGDPFETVDTPFTTPVGFYNGQTHAKSDFNWPGSAATYQPGNGVNGYGLYDMSGNVWQWCNDWYSNPYYGQSPADNPTGPTKTAASPMPDGKPYRCLRGGNWFNGNTFYGHGRISNRNPSYFRGPGDPNGPWFHIGFRVVLKSDGGTAALPGLHSSTNAGRPALSVRLAGGSRVVFYCTVTAGSAASLRIFDLLGTTIFVCPISSPGSHQIEWQGGERVNAGSYIAVLSDGAQAITSRMIIYK